MCKKCANVGRRKRRRRKSRVGAKGTQAQAMKVIKSGAVAAIGYTASNLVSSKVEELAVSNGYAYDQNYAGIVKTVAGVLTVVGANKYSRKNLMTATALGGGMVASGMLDLASKNLPASAKTALGIAGPGNNRYLSAPRTARVLPAPVRRNTASSNVSTGNKVVIRKVAI